MRVFGAGPMRVGFSGRLHRIVFSLRVDMSAAALTSLWRCIGTEAAALTCMIEADRTRASRSVSAHTGARGCARVRKQLALPMKSFVRIAMAALADPLLRIFGAVDRRDAVADSHGEQRSHGAGAVAGQNPGREDPEPERVSDLSQNGLSQNGLSQNPAAQTPPYDQICGRESNFEGDQNH